MGDRADVVIEGNEIMSTDLTVVPNIEYPDDDGLPMSDNSLQSYWIVTIHSNLDAIFAEYPVEGRPSIRFGPDVFVVFGRPKKYRGSYMQWTEDDTPITVVFEILSPGNRDEPMDAKKKFYERYGVEEYYVYDPHSHGLDGFLREDERFVAVANMNGWTSPLLGIRFDLSGADLVIFDPTGVPFRPAQAAIRGERQAQRELQASKRREKAAKRRADEEKQRAEEELQRAEAEKLRADRLAEKLRQLGIDPDA
jgi:Uma2 family endonuclease